MERGISMKDNKGMTLVELVVSIAIIGVVLLAIYSFMISGVQGFARETTTATNQAQVRRVSNNIGREIRRATEVDKLDESIQELTLTYSDGTKVVYRLEDENIKADYYDEDDNLDRTSKLASGIKTLGIDIENDTVKVFIESVENTRGKTYELTTELTKRK